MLAKGHWRWNCQEREKEEDPRWGLWVQWEDSKRWKRMICGDPQRQQPNEEKDSVITGEYLKQCHSYCLQCHTTSTRVAGVLLPKLQYSANTTVTVITFSVNNLNFRTKIIITSDNSINSVRIPEQYPLQQSSVHSAVPTASPIRTMLTTRSRRAGVWWTVTRISPAMTWIFHKVPTKQYLQQCHNDHELYHQL